MPEVAPPLSGRGEIQKEFLQRLKSRKEWRTLSNLSFQSDTSFIREVVDGFKHFLRQGNIRTAQSVQSVKMILCRSDKERFDKIDFKNAARKIAREALTQGDLKLYNKIQDAFGEGESLIGEDEEAIIESYLACLDMLNKRFAQINRLNGRLINQRAIRKAVESILLKAKKH